MSTAEEPTTTTAAAAAVLSVGEEPPVLEGKRVRKQTTFFEVPRASTADKEKDRKTKAAEVSAGEGDALGESAHFCAALDKLRGDDDLVKALHSLCFDRSGKRTETKRNLRAFRGFPSSTASTAAERLSRVLEKKKVWTIAALKQVLSMCGQPVSGERETLARRLVDFLAAPRVADKDKGEKGAQKREKGKKRKAASKKSDKDQPKKKRAPSAFVLFSNAKRDELKKKSPGLTFGEVGQRLGEMWRELGDAQKKKWLDQADTAKAALAGEEAEAEAAEEEEEEDAEEAQSEDPFADDDEEEEKEKEEKEEEKEKAVEEAVEEAPAKEQEEEKKEEEAQEEEQEKKKPKAKAAAEKKKRGKK